jgi:hypothetical protein
MTKAVQFYVLPDDLTVTVTVRGVPIRVKQVVVDPAWWQTLLARGPTAGRLFVEAQRLYRRGEGDVFVLFVELVDVAGLPPDAQAAAGGHTVLPRILGCVHESDPDSPSAGWTKAEQREAFEDMTAQVFQGTVPVTLH